MAPKGGITFLLLIVACAALAMHPYKMPGNRPDFKGMAKKLMRRCQEKGYPVPKIEQLRTVFNDSDLPTVDRNSGQSNTFLSTFMDIMGSVSPAKGSRNRIPMADKMTNEMWNCSNLSTMIKLMRNSSEASACYMRAFVAPLSWETLTTRCEDDKDSDDYDTLLVAATPALQDIPTSKMTFPSRTAQPKVKKMMKMLKKVYGTMSEKQRKLVVKWAKQQITQNYFNCTTNPSPNSSLKEMEHCKPSLKWLDLEALAMMGPYLSSLAPDDVDSSPKEKLCKFYHSAQFKSTLRMATKMKPSLAKRFLKRIQECFRGKEEFAKDMDKLGSLACYYDAVPDMTPDLSKKLLSQLDDCDNPRIKRLKKHLVRSMMSKDITVQVLRELGSSVALLSPEQLFKLPGKDRREFLKTIPVPWTKHQQRSLVKKELGDKCKLPLEDLRILQFVAGGLPNCALKHVKTREVLNDTEVLGNVSKRMKKWQMKAMLQVLCKDVDISELVEKLPSILLSSMSLNVLAEANITSLDQVKHKNWSRAQAAYLVKNLKKISYRRLQSLIQGFTCKMIDKLTDSDVQDMAEGMADTPQWVSKMQAGCVARRFCAAMEKKRANYFKTISPEELDEIPIFILLNLPPSKVKDLPDSVCSVLLDKTEVANLSSVPLRVLPLAALTKRALLCLANGTDLSGLTSEDVSRLGQLLCELHPSQLRLMAPDVLNSSLEAMASCQHIPKRHRVDLIQLVTQTFGDPSDWSAETMEDLGPLLLWDDNATSALPNKPWMKDVLYYLRSRLSHASTALRKKLFLLTTMSDATRKKREANSNSSGHEKANSGSITGTDPSSDSSTMNTQVPTVEMSVGLEEDNIFWKETELEKMTAETFLGTVEIYGRICNYSADKLAVLSRKAVKAFGPVSQMNESVVTQLGCITRGFSDAELEQLPFSMDTLDEIACCGWNESQMESVWKAVAKHNNLTAQQLEAAEMVALNQFICGLNFSEIGQLNMTTFKGALGSMNDVQCSFKVAQQLKSLAVSAFGNPSTWTEAQVSDLGNIIAGLDGAELASLDPSVCSFINSFCIPLISPSNFAFFTVAQLEDFGPDNAAKVTREQKDALSKEQQDALQRAMAGSRNQTVPSDNSGAPSLSVEGMSAFLKPLLFLLTGFLLL